MLESIDLKTSIEKDEYRELYPRLALELRRLQREARETGLPVVVVVEGWEAAGKGDAVSKLMEVFDPRGARVYPIYPPLEDERLRPFLWRFWKKTPARGAISIFFRSWYRRVLDERLEGIVPKSVWKRAYREINEFERQLAADGTLVVKFWLHIDKKEQKKRFEKFEKDRFERWKVDADDWKRHKLYDDYLLAVEEMLEGTSTSEVPWTIIPATKRFYRRIKIFESLIKSLADAIEKRRTRAEDTAPEVQTPASDLLQRVPGILDRAELSLRLDDETYRRRLKKAQVRLRELEFACLEHRVPVMIVYEGWDAAGKGGNIRRLSANLDPRGYEVIPIAAPVGDEKTHHYLWRFWKALPKAGHFAIFDRSWYGRVLVERVEGLCSKEAWQRAYREINEFERQLTDFGTVIVKFWLHIDQEEQLARFEARKDDPFKSFKLTDEDWRNRDKWPVYRAAVTDMLERTSTTYAPWTLVEANDKAYARVKTLETVCEAVEKRLKKGRSGKKAA